MSPRQSSRPRVYSKRKGAPPPPEGAVYVGRGTVWGNAWRIGVDGTREEVVEKYREFTMRPDKARLRERIRKELGGKDLVCWCAPEACHADVLLEVANAPVADRLPAR